MSVSSRTKLFGIARFYLSNMVNVKGFLTVRVEAGKFFLGEGVPGFQHLFGISVLGASLAMTLFDIQGREAWDNRRNSLRILQADGTAPSPGVLKSLDDPRLY
jgi:hypothetical protein